MFLNKHLDFRNDLQQVMSRVSDLALSMLTDHEQQRAEKRSVSRFNLIPSLVHDVFA